jgi:serine/threonine-protein kinase
MSEVYRAQDTQLGRDVALKILPDIFLSDAARRSRFEREARLLAALNHPYIGAIYGLEDLNGSHVLILELVDGESLAQRLAAGPLPVAQATALARQIAYALEAAHEKGIVHRDLKPANIMVTADDQVKVLDFGLARASHGSDPSSAANSPTLTVGATQAGVLLGTAAYMAPEQAKGRVADKRSDVWAFGCVLYEMLSGRPPFEGATVSDTLASVLRDDPDWGALPAVVPASLRTLLRRCLKKDRKTRIPDLAVARFMLDDAPAADALVRRAPVKRLIAIGALALLAGSAVTGLAVWTLMRGRPVPPVQTVRNFISLTAPQTLAAAQEARRPFVISADGRHLVFVARANPGGALQLMTRSIDQLETVPIQGTEGARDPFLSPDGEWIGYRRGSVLKKVRWNGGPSETLRTSAGRNGAAWLSDNSIIVGANDPRIGLMQLPAGAGEPVVLTRPDQAGHVHSDPSVLPGGRAVFFTVDSGEVGGIQNPQVAMLDLKTHAWNPLFSGRDAQYVDTGHLVYAASGTLRAVRFDPDQLEIVGDSAPVVDQVIRMTHGTAAFTVSRNGILIYLRGTAAETARRALVWVNRNGNEEPLPTQAQAYTHPRLSPDGTRVALIRLDQDHKLWIFDIARHNLTKLTGGDLIMNPVWTPDSRKVMFASLALGSTNVFRQLADNTGDIEQLTFGTHHFTPSSVTPDGTRAVLSDGSQLAVLHLDGTTPQIEPLLPSTFNVANGEISPNGRWLAYQSNESEGYQIYVRPFPKVESGKWQISNSGGTKPAWARSGTELFYIDADGHLMAVPVQTRSDFVHGTPKKVFDARYFSDEWGRTYDVARDGRSFLMLKDVGDPPAMVMVANWFEELKKLLPVTSR